MKHIRVGGFVFAVVLVAVPVLAPGASDRVKVSLGGARTASGNERCAPGEFRFQSVGVGVDKAGALRDAFQDAVKRSVGFLLDAETVVKNDKLIKDQILTQSNAYVTQYEEQGLKKIDGGLMEIRILATVRVRSLRDGLQSSLPKTARFKEGLTADFALNETRLQNAEDAAKLVAAKLQEVDPCSMLMEASLDATTKKVISEGKILKDSHYVPIPADKACLRYLLRIRVDETKYYQQLVPRLEPIFDQISLTPPKTIRFAPLELERRCVLSGEDYVSGTGDGARKGRDSKELGRVNPVYGTFRELYGGGLAFGLRGSDRGEYAFAERGCRLLNRGDLKYYSILGERDNWFDDDRIAQNYPFGENSYALVLITKVNKAHTIWTGKYYTFDKRVAVECQRWLRNSCARPDDNRWEPAFARYDVTFADKDGEPVAQDSFSLPRRWLVNVDHGSVEGGVCTTLWYVCPFVGTFAEEFLQWKDFILDKNLLPEIEAATISHRP